jgi:hypothetical protein
MITATVRHATLTDNARGAVELFDEPALRSA